MSSIDINISSINDSSLKKPELDNSSVDINISTKTSFKINIKLPALNKSGISINMFNPSPTKNSEETSLSIQETILLNFEKTPEKKCEKDNSLTPIGENWYGDTPDEVKRKFLLEDITEDDQSLDTPYLDRNVKKKSNIDMPLSQYRNK